VKPAWTKFISVTGMIRRNLPLPTCPGWTPQWFGPYFAITIAVRVSARLIGRFIVAELQAQIHPRMPVILPEKHHAAWLGEAANGN
jgi:hypothetical protein